MKRRTFFLSGGTVLAQTAPFGQVVLGVVGSGGAAAFPPALRSLPNFTSNFTARTDGLL
jgi:hypothetical protein